MNDYIDKILLKTDGGYNVFLHYLGDICTQKMFKNPYREDHMASCHLHLRRGTDGKERFFLHDFGSSEWRGDCFWFVGKIININTTTSFMEVLEVIDNDLNLGVLSNKAVDMKLQPRSNPQPPQPMNSISYSEASYPLRFSHIYQNFHPKDIDYWKQYGIDLMTLVRYQVKSIRYCKFIRPDDSAFSICTSFHYPIYGYLVNHGMGIKIYRPAYKNRFMYAGHLPNPYLFGFDELPRQGDTVYITGGEKDVLSLAAHGFSALCFNSETARVPEDVMANLSGRFHHIVFLYDCDETGKRESERWVKEYEGIYPVSRLILPLAGTKQEKDISDYFAKGYSALDLMKLI